MSNARSGFFKLVPLSTGRFGRHCRYSSTQSSAIFDSGNIVERRRTAENGRGKRKVVDR